MSEDNQKNQEKKLPRESFDEFCKRLGIRIVNEPGGVEFSPYRGPQKSDQAGARAAQRSVSNDTLYVWCLRSVNSFHNHRQMRSLNIARGRA
jgi:hypothetical protein